MAPSRTKNYTIRASSTGSRLNPSESQGQRNKANNDNVNPSAALFPMSLPPSYREERAVHRALQKVAPELDVERIEKLPTGRIQSVYNISLAGGKSLVLSAPESNSNQALRSEDNSVTIEAAAVCWLASLPSQGSQPSKQGNHIVYGDCEPGRDIVNYTGDSVNVCYVSQFMPKLIKFIPQGGEPPITDLALWEPTRGRTIAHLGRELSVSERQTFDFQTGQLFRRLSCHISPTGNFGPIGHVLRSISKIPYWHALGLLPSHPTEVSPSDIGRGSWSVCFKGYMEEVAGDLGDFYIQMAFDSFRDHYHRLKHLLDKVQVPRLVAIQGADDSNVMISIPGETDILSRGGMAVKKSQSTTSTGGAICRKDHRCRSGINVTGLRDWSFFCFGDPLIAYAFQDGPSKEFQTGMETSFSDSDPLLHEPLVEDEVHAPVRLALYKAWHAAYGVARQYRRVRDEKTDWELVWRGKFKRALDTLDRFDDEGNEISEGSPSKRARTLGSL